MNDVADRSEVPVTVRKLILDTLGNAGAFVVTKLRGVVMMVALVYVTGIEAYGLWIQVMTVAGLFSLIGGLGLSNALVRFYPDAERNGGRAQLLSNVVIPVAISSALAGVVMLSLALPLADLFADGKHDMAFAIGAAMTVLMPIRLLLATWFRAQDKMSEFSRQHAGWEAADFALALPLLLVFGTVEAALAGSAIAALFYVAALLRICVKDAGGLVRPDQGMRENLRYALPIVPTAIADESLARSDRLIIGALIGPAAAGIYSAIYALASVTQILNSALFNSLMPKIIRVHNADGRRSRRWLKQTAGWYGLAAATVVALLIPLVPVLTGLLTDNAAGGEPVTLIYVLCGLGVVLFGVGRIVSAELYLSVRTGLVALIWGGAAALNAALGLALIGRFELVGAAAASAVSYGVFLILQTLAMARSRRSLDGVASQAVPAVPVEPASRAG